MRQEKLKRDEGSAQLDFLSVLGIAALDVEVGVIELI